MSSWPSIILSCVGVATSGVFQPISQVLAGDAAEGGDDQREHRVVRGRGDRLVEGDVVLHDRLGPSAVARASAARVAGDRLGLRVGAAQRGERDSAHLDRAAHIIDLLDADLLRW